MRVQDLITQLKGLDPEAHVEFHDLTYGRVCPVNSVCVKEPTKLQGRGCLVVLTNHPQGEPL